MAAGDTNVLGPYELGDTATMAANIAAAGGGAVAKNVTTYLDAQQKVYVIVVDAA